MLFFKHPVFLYTLISIVVLVLFHLIKRKNIKKVNYSSIQFILRSHKKISKKLKIREALLFLFRLLTLTIIILLLANTSIQESNKAMLQLKKENKCIVLDNNYQMLLKTGKKTDFERAKDMLREYFKSDLGNNTFFFKGKQYRIHSLSQLNNLLEKIKISYDFKSSTIYDLLQNKEKLNKSNVTILSNYRDTLSINNLNYSLLDQETIDNFYIKNLRIKQVKNDRYQLKLLIGSSSDAVKTKTIRLYANEKKIAQSIVRLSPYEIKEVSFHFLNHKTKNTEHSIEYRVSLESDNLSYDNHKFFTINSEKPKEIAIINGEINAISYQDESFYFKNAIQSSHMKYHFNLTQKSWITAKEMQQYDLLIFLNNSFDDIDNRLGINTFLDKGKSIFISLGSNTTLESFNAFWKGIIKLRNFKDLNKTKEYKFLNYFNYDYSPLKGINFIKSELSSYPVKKYFNIETKQNTKLIASLNDGTPLLLEKNLEKGKLILYTTSIDRDWNDFPISTNYPPLILSLIKYLVYSNKIINNYYVTSLKDIKTDNNKTNLKSGIYKFHKKIAYNTNYSRSIIKKDKNKDKQSRLVNNNLLIPLKNWFIIILIGIIFLETLFFIKRYLWIKNE